MCARCAAGARREGAVQAAAVLREEAAADARGGAHGRQQGQGLRLAGEAFLTPQRLRPREAMTLKRQGCAYTTLRCRSRPPRGVDRHAVSTSCLHGAQRGACESSHLQLDIWFHVGLGGRGAARRQEAPLAGRLRLGAHEGEPLSLLLTASPRAAPSVIMPPLEQLLCENLLHTASRQCCTMLLDPCSRLQLVAVSQKPSSHLYHVTACARCDTYRPWSRAWRRCW